MIIKHLNFNKSEEAFKRLLFQTSFCTTTRSEKWFTNCASQRNGCWHAPLWLEFGTATGMLWRSLAYVDTNSGSEMKPEVTILPSHDSGDGVPKDVQYHPPPSVRTSVCWRSVRMQGVAISWPNLTNSKYSSTPDLSLKCKREKNGQKDPGGGSWNIGLIL